MKSVLLLESIGFSQEAGTWYGPDDEPFTLDLHSPSSDWSTYANTISGQLKQFGIETDVLTESTSTYFSKYSEKTYPFTMEWWAGGKATPYDGIDRNMRGFGGGTMDYPLEVEAPPVGNRTGELQTYDIESMLDTALSADSEQGFVDAIQELAWVQNYELPCVGLLLQEQGGWWIDSEGWTYPDLGSPEWAHQKQINWFMLNGEFQAR